MRPRLVWLLWDAGAATMADRFLAEGRLPNLARLVARGFRAACRPSWPCSQTPPGMATLLTGAPTAGHGIYGFREAARPRSAKTAVETETGFDARRLAAEPLWSTAARAGRSAAIAFAPLANPHSAYAPGGRWAPPEGVPPIVAFDGYGSVLEGQAAHRSSELPRGPRGFEIVLPFAETPVTLVIEPGPELRVSVAGGDATGSLPLRLREATSVPLRGTVGVTLVLLERNGDAFTLWRSGVWRLSSSVPGAAEEMFRLVGPFLGSGAGHLYRDGLLGESCRTGGSGDTERRCLATIAASAQFFTRASRHVLERFPADVTVLYEPCIDEAAHVFQDLVEESHPCALEVARAAYGLADEHLGAVLDRVGDDAIVAIGSDHGQQGVKAVFKPNVVLHEAGLLAVDEGGHIDLGRTKVLYGPAANGYLLVNSDASPRGIVPRAEAAKVAREAAELLLARRDERGEPFLLAAYAAGEATPRGRTPGADAGDYCLFAAPGVTLGTSAVGAASEASSGGQHTTALDVPELDALFAVGGPGVPRLGRLAERFHNLDVAPTLAKLIGIPAPAQATGQPLV